MNRLPTLATTLLREAARQLRDVGCGPSGFALAYRIETYLKTKEPMKVNKRRTRKEHAIARARRAVMLQREFIANCGGDEAGYVARYGKNGAEIHAADQATLATLEKQLTAEVGLRK